MNSRTRCNAFIVAFFFLCFIGTLTYPGDAHARRRGIAFVNTGSEFFDVAPLPPELGDELDGRWKLAYKCERLGVFWADVWTWDCGMVAFDGDNTYADLPPDMIPELEAQHPFSQAQRSLWNRFGIIAVAGAGLIGGIGRRLGAA